MRLRNIPRAESVLEACKEVVKDPESLRGNWNQTFKKEQPLHIEIGMGKGQFLLTLAAKNPQINYIGIERYSSVLLRAVEKFQELEAEGKAPANIRFICMDANDLPTVFAPAEVSRIYLNFSDPWPPNRQRKRRLTWRAYLEVYDEILRQQGDLCFKTDNQRFFEWSLQEICQFGWLLQNISLDLHNSDFEGNVMTEYEEKFSSEGSRIYRVEARRRLPEFLRK